ncbi:porin [Crenobacter sp. SG2305]|uniref:porin n=1 Tax=Crenobacter oryzisoli TaxID=3056844 RepID=UPI0025AB228A|nr:porin [Crenobacter sp. SG2305]MDN0083888.1 porin [Crenobacter sp. SG2305]
MKKTIILAPSLALMSVMAHADVTIYGVFDTTMESVSAKGATSPGKNVASTSRVNSNSSLIGFKGTEDLGDGLKTIWQVESGIAMDTGGGYFATRDTFVGLSSATAGTVQMGLLTGPARMIPALWDLNQGTTGIGMGGAIAGKLGNLVFVDPALRAQSTFSPANGTGNTQMQLGPFETRTRNAVMYTSPTWHSTSASAMYAPGETSTSSHAYKAEASIKYDDGATYASAAYGRLDTGVDDNAALSQSAFRSLSTARAAAFYRFTPQTRVGLLFDRMEGQLTTAGAASLGGSTLRQNVWMANGSLGITTNGKLIAQYAHAGELTGGSPATAGHGNAQYYELGYEYSLSKRTILKAIYVEVRNGASANYDFGIGSIGGVADGAKPRGIALGLRHTL